MEDFDVDWYTVQVYDRETGTTTTISKQARYPEEAMNKVADEGEWEPLRAWIEEY